mmetsp:Transcript_38771/g.92661  ORF Transcript_38771/g.92661 Transcript_38771/m.92661 type:complete len:274 (-) Transcript_38771:892-1713(-)
MDPGPHCEGGGRPVRERSALWRDGELGVPLQQATGRTAVPPHERRGEQALLHLRLHGVLRRELLPGGGHVSALRRRRRVGPGRPADGHHWALYQQLGQLGAQEHPQQLAGDTAGRHGRAAEVLRAGQARGHGGVGHHHPELLQRSGLHRQHVHDAWRLQGEHRQPLPCGLRLRLRHREDPDDLYGGRGRLRPQRRHAERGAAGPQHDHGLPGLRHRRGRGHGRCVLGPGAAVPCAGALDVLRHRALGLRRLHGLHLGLHHRGPQPLRLCQAEL